jgi:hypothetical protein
MPKSLRNDAIEIASAPLAFVIAALRRSAIGARPSGDHGASYDATSSNETFMRMPPSCTVTSRLWRSTLCTTTRWR